jgi:hypothetical protein
VLDSSTVSNQNGGLHVQTLLNPQELPSRNSVPDTPSSRYSYGQQVRWFTPIDRLAANTASPMLCRQSTSHMTTG